MDPDIEELKDLVKKSLAVSEETNHIVRSMRRGVRWGHFFTILWWALIIGSSWFGYIYLQPYIAQVVKLYQGGQAVSQEGQSYLQRLEEYFNTLKPGQGSTPPTQIN